MAAYRGEATKRYIRRVIAMALAHVALVFIAVETFKRDAVSGLLAWVFAIAPALPLIGVFWAVMRLLIEEQDEFIRLLIVRQCLVATGFSLAVVTVWEWLANFSLVAPAEAGFGAAFFWFVGLGVGALWNKVTMGTAGEIR